MDRFTRSFVTTQRASKYFDLIRRSVPSSPIGQQAYEKSKNALHQTNEKANISVGKTHSFKQREEDILNVGYLRKSPRSSSIGQQAYEKSKNALHQINEEAKLSVEKSKNTLHQTNEKANISVEKSKNTLHDISEEADLSIEKSKNTLHQTNEEADLSIEKSKNTLHQTNEEAKLSVEKTHGFKQREEDILNYYFHKYLRSESTEQKAYEKSKNTLHQINEEAKHSVEKTHGFKKREEDIIKKYDELILKEKGTIQHEDQIPPDTQKKLTEYEQTKRDALKKLQQEREAFEKECRGFLERQYMKFFAIEETRAISNKALRWQLFSATAKFLNDSGMNITNVIEKLLSDMMKVLIEGKF